MAWEADPKAEQPKHADGSPDFSNVGPYSATQVIDDLKAEPATTPDAKKNKENNTALTISIVSLVIALSSLARSRKAIKS